MKKSIIFTTNIFQFKNENLAIALKKYILTKEIKGIESNVAPAIKHNLDESKFNFLQDENEIIKKTGSFFAKCLRDTFNDLRKEDSNYKITITESWYHVGRKNSSHEAHIHSNCSWCGIFYIESGDLNSGGKTFFNHPIQSTFSDLMTIHKEETAFAVQPEIGKLVIFPSYLSHFQSLYTGSKDRIVVAFNCKVDEIR